MSDRACGGRRIELDGPEVATGHVVTGTHWEVLPCTANGILRTRCGYESHLLIWMVFTLSPFSYDHPKCPQTGEYCRPRLTYSLDAGAIAINDSERIS